MSLTSLDRARLAELLDLARDPRRYSPISVPTSLFLKLVSEAKSVQARTIRSAVAGAVLGSFITAYYFS